MIEPKNIPRRLLVLNTMSLFLMGAVIVYLVLSLLNTPPLHWEEHLAAVEGLNELQQLRLRSVMQVSNNNTDILRVLTILGIVALVIELCVLRYTRSVLKKLKID